MNAKKSVIKEQCGSKGFLQDITKKKNKCGKCMCRQTIMSYI